MARVLVGLNFPVYYAGFNPYLNWWQIGSAITLTRSGGGDLTGKDIWDNGTYLDTATGELLADTDVLTISRAFCQNPPSPRTIALGADYTGETWTATWDGTATAAFSEIGTGSSQSSPTANSRICTFGTAPGAAVFTLTVTDPEDPPLNIKVFQTRYASNVAAGERFNPDWLAVVSQFRTLRFLDVQRANSYSGTPSLIEDFDQLAGWDYSTLSSDFHATSQHGPKGSIHPEIICDLAAATGCRVHVHIPVRATDAFVTSFATYMRDNCSTEVAYEYCNEAWHGGFEQYAYCAEQGEAALPDVSGDCTVFGGTTGGGAHACQWQLAWRWYGYRSSQIMKIVKDIYNDSTRWHGVFNTSFTATTALIEGKLYGFDKWKSDTSSSLNMSDLFKAVYVAGYFGYVDSAYLSTKTITNVTQANPAVVTSAGHGFTNGTRIKIFIGNGMTQLNDTYATVAGASTDTFQLSGVNSSGYTAWESQTGNNRAFAIRSELYDAMDESESLHNSDPTNYPTKYTYYSQQLKECFITGTCDAGFTSSQYVDQLVSTYWPALKTKATEYGLELRQYEANSHFLGDDNLINQGPSSQFNEFLDGSGWTQELADVLEHSYRGFHSIGGLYTAKFNIDGAMSEYGTWGCVRYFPTVANSGTTDDNPVREAIERWNASLLRITLTTS